MTEQLLIEDEISHHLSGETQINALTFVGCLRANQLSPELHESGDGYSILCNGESVGFILVVGAENQLWVWFNACDFGDGNFADEG